VIHLWGNFVISVGLGEGRAPRRWKIGKKKCFKNGCQCWARGSKSGPPGNFVSDTGGKGGIGGKRTVRKGCEGECSGRRAKIVDREEKKHGRLSGKEKGGSEREDRCVGAGRERGQTGKLSP